LIADADMLARRADDRIRSREGGQRREDASRSALACEAVADAHAERLAPDLDAKLAARA
jgi:hypothetical protein